MVYITVKQPPMFHQMTLEELLFQDYKGPMVINANESNTRTYEFNFVQRFFMYAKAEVWYRTWKSCSYMVFCLRSASISSLITNVMMIPVDFKLTKAFRNYEKQRFVYTRYADSMV